MQRGDFSSARTNVQRNLAAWDNRPSDYWYWKFKLLDAELFLLNGNTSEARRLLTKPPPGAFANLTPRYTMLLSYAAFRRNDAATARRLLDSAITGARAAGDYETEADSDLLLAAYAPSTAPGGAESLITRSLQLTRAHHLDYQSAALQLDLGMIRMHQARYSAAIEALQQSSSAALQAHATLLYSMIIGNLATCYYDLGDFDRSMDLRAQAIRTQEHAGLDTPLRDSLLDLGAAQILEGDTTAGIASMRRALALADPHDTPEVYSLIASNLAAALESTGELDEAQSMNARALASAPLSDSNAHLWLDLNQAGIDEHRGSREFALRSLLEIARKSAHDPALTWSAESAAAQILAARGDSTSAMQARVHFEAALAAIEASRAEQLETRYQITFLARLIRLYQSYVALLVHQGDIRQALLVADSSRASVLTNSITGNHGRDRPAILDRAQAAARRTRSAILFYFVAPAESYLWIITGKGLQCKTLPGESDLTSLVRSYQRLLETEKTDPLQTRSLLPQRLFTTLVTPAGRALADTCSVIVIPDGPLHRLNFATLIVPGSSPHYWLQDVTLAVAPSIHLLTSPPVRSPTRPASLLLIGDPLSPEPAYAMLPYAPLEMQDVQHRFPSGATTLVSQSAAVPSAFAAARPERFAFIHIAAHAEANQRSPLDSAIILSREPGGYRLYARDIMTKHLTANLVVLSACRSAGARTLSGEGPVGFAWAFFQAGAQNVAASLWDVNDRSTATLMDHFYAQVNAGLLYPEALRQAQLAVLKTTSKPYYWAPFQLYVRTFPRTDSASGKSSLSDRDRLPGPLAAGR